MRCLHVRVSLFAASSRTAYRAQCEKMLSIDQAQIDLAAGPLGILDDTARLRHQVGL